MENKLIIMKGTTFHVRTLDSGNLEIAYEHGIQLGDIMFCSSPSTRWVCIMDKVVGHKSHYLVSYNLDASILKTSDWFRNEYLQRPATDQERKILFQAISRNGYTWDKANRKLVEKDDKSIIPISIGIFRLLSNTTPTFNIGDGLLISSGFDNNLLCVTDGTPTIFKNSDCLFKRVKCRLIPCPFNELKEGDTAFMGGNDTDIFKPKFYVKILKRGYAYINRDSPIKSFNDNFDWYRVVSIEDEKAN